MQAAGRRVAYHTFSHVLDLDLAFHLERRTGTLTRILERGSLPLYPFIVLMSMLRVKYIQPWGPCMCPMAWNANLGLKLCDMVSSELHLVPVLQSIAFAV